MEAHSAILVSDELSWRCTALELDGIGTFGFKVSTGAETDVTVMRRSASNTTVNQTNVR